MNQGLKTARKWLKEADAILVTASNGFSISEGLNLFAQDQRVETVLKEIAQKHKFPNIISASMFPYESELERWQVFARLNEYYSYNYYPGKLMEDLHELIDGKPHMIWTSNVENHFAKADFENYLEMEGSWNHAICKAHPKEHGIQDISEKLHAFYQKDMAHELTEADVLRCEVCGEELVLHTPGPEFYLDPAKLEGFKQFIQTYEQKNLVVLELGIGPHNQLIKHPIMQLVESRPQMHYITINKGELNIKPTIADRTVGFSAKIDESLKALLTGKDKGLEIIAPTNAMKYEPKSQHEDQEKADAIIKKFYPSYVVNSGIRPMETVMNMTIDEKHPSYLHYVDQGQGIMYVFGSPVTAHYFEPSGQYRKIELGLDKSRGQDHGFYAESGSFVGFELSTPNPSGFGQISVSFLNNSNQQIMMPRKDKFMELYPKQKEIIERLVLKDEG